jgi:phosphatidylglycerophosphate synthase
MDRMAKAPILVIDARPRGPVGPYAAVALLGRPVLDRLVDQAARLGFEGVTIHARVDEFGPFQGLITRQGETDVRFAPGPPPAGAVVLRTDRIYEDVRLRRALARRRDPERAAFWRLDGPGGLEHAEAELTRRTTYQPLGRYWAFGPSRALARALVPTRVRPNALTLAAAGLVFSAAAGLAIGGETMILGRAVPAVLLALALVLDTADGHLARLQGTASAFGRWLDAVLDEAGDLALHLAIGWAAFSGSGQPLWLVLAFVYAMGKSLFAASSTTWDDITRGNNASTRHEAGIEHASESSLKRAARLAGHADVRWHLWIVLAALGLLHVELIAYAAYYPLRTLAGVRRKWRSGTHV